MVWIILPADKNNMDLNIAWERRWKNVIILNPIHRTLIITPSCLNVDRAMTFLKSYSIFALPLAINMVNMEIRNKIDLILLFIIYSNRIRRYTPAVTSVDECTRDDTGVGAAIAAGSQAENGI